MPSGHPRCTTSLATPDPRSSAIQVHLCALSTRSAVDPQAILDRHELERYHRYRQGADRERLLISRLLAKTVLASSLGCRPGSITIAADCRGRPYVVQDRRWQLSLSHSGQVIALALSAAGQVGIDAEAIDPRCDCLSLARRCFAPAEVSCLEGLSHPQLLQGFYQLWTAKEALAKASALGLEQVLAMDLSAVLRDLWCTVPMPTARSWRLHDLGSWRGCRLAIACAAAASALPGSASSPPRMRAWSLGALSMAWHRPPASIRRTSGAACPGSAIARIPQ